MPRRTAFFFTLGFLLLATLASAGTYTVTLTNGTSFVTRYEPVDAEWDDNVVMLNSDQGNWIALPKDEIADVVSDVEASGFGYQVNTTTVFVGWSPNESEGEGEGEGGEGEGAGEGEFDNLPDPNPAPSFGLEQFVDIPGSGGGVGTQPVRNF